MGVLTTYTVTLCSRQDIKNFIEKHHYSGSINGTSSRYCYALHDPEGNLVGALFYGQPAMHNQWKRFAEHKDQVLELRRLVCVDATPKNTESYFIGCTLRLLEKHWRPDGIVISYSDLEQGHEGTVYKASNFEFWGFKKGGKVIDFQGKIYHDKTVRTRYKGQLKPFAHKIKVALETGEAFYRKVKGKNTYVYYLDKRVRKNRRKQKES